ncbi:MAG TPA: nuclear transport factor 2 family protein [Euzebyales bacterium]|nr:nuclear transport factor 2 family protein [Euzebyales bacterium]
MTDGEDATHTAARIATIRAALLVAASGDATQLPRIYLPDVTGWSPVLEVTSRDDLAADLRNHPGHFSGVDVVLDAVDVIGDKVIAEWRLAATHSGALIAGELRAGPATRRIELRGVFVAEFDGARIRRFRQYWDEAELLDQLGLLPDA